MYVKIYFSLCATLLAASMILFATGALTPMVAVWLGFIAFGVVFMGMIAVLPTTVHVVPKPKALRVGPNKLESVVDRTSSAIRNIGAEMAVGHAAETGKQKFR